MENQTSNTVAVMLVGAVAGPNEQGDMSADTPGGKGMMEGDGRHAGVAQRSAKGSCVNNKRDVSEGSADPSAILGRSSKALEARLLAPSFIDHVGEGLRESETVIVELDDDKDRFFAKSSKTFRLMFKREFHTLRSPPKSNFYEHPLSYAKRAFVYSDKEYIDIIRLVETSRAAKAEKT